MIGDSKVRIHLPSQLAPFPLSIVNVLMQGDSTGKKKAFCAQVNLRNTVGYFPLFKIHNVQQCVTSLTVKALFISMLSKTIWPQDFHSPQQLKSINIEQN